MIGETGQVARTILIARALDMLATSRVRIAKEGWPTVALLSVVLHTAQRILATAVRFKAQVQALRVDARLIVGAVNIGRTLHPNVARGTAWSIADAFIAAHQVDTAESRMTSILILFTLVNVFARSIDRKGKASRTAANAFG